MKGQTAEASITASGSTYTVTSGDDLFNLLTNNKNYWSSRKCSTDGSDNQGG